MARPTKYNDEIVEKARDYLINYAKYDDIMPSIVGMAIALNVGKSTLYDWASDPEKEFSDILDECMDRQERILLKNGLTGDFTAPITKLALGKHGYSDKIDNDNVHSFDMSGMSKEQLREIIDS